MPYLIFTWKSLKLTSLSWQRTQDSITFNVQKLKKGKGKDHIHTALVVMGNFLLVLAA
jgi:hypothetical protein